VIKEGVNRGFGGERICHVNTINVQYDKFVVFIIIRDKTRDEGNT
jgi:hypothetical protein